jgi:hypothetical protein
MWVLKEAAVAAMGCPPPAAAIQPHLAEDTFSGMAPHEIRRMADLHLWRMEQGHTAVRSAFELHALCSIRHPKLSLMVVAPNLVAFMSNRPGDPGAATVHMVHVPVGWVPGAQLAGGPVHPLGEWVMLRPKLAAHRRR